MFRVITNANFVWIFMNSKDYDMEVFYLKSKKSGAKHPALYPLVWDSGARLDILLLVNWLFKLCEKRNTWITVKPREATTSLKRLPNYSNLDLLPFYTNWSLTTVTSSLQCPPHHSDHLNAVPIAKITLLQCT